MSKEKFIASLDVGTTTIRCYIFDSKCNIIGTASQSVELLNHVPGYFEIDPEKLWDSIVNVIKISIERANLTISDISCLGISTQRNSFITWDQNTKECFHNFITWKDIRANDLVNKWNSSFLLKTINIVSYCLYLLSRNNRFLAGSVLKMMNSQVTLRLLWQIENNEKLKYAIDRKTALFGTLDSWLLYKLRNGLTDTYTEHISDITSATATGLFDPFTLSWASWALKLFKINVEMLPKVVENSYVYGYVHDSVFGNAIKISSSISDQSAAMWGSCCFNKGDVKVTLGTGSFWNLNTGNECHASVKGFYPLVAWAFNFKYSELKINYCVEGAANDTGTIIAWGQNFGLYDDPSKTSDIAESVEDSNGVYFVPAFSGIGPPINDYKAASGFFGIRPSTTKSHLTRALLESIAFRVCQLYECCKSETNYKLKCIRVDGGVSKNNFICQTIANISGLNVERAFFEGSVLGAAFVAGINEGIWNHTDELRKFRVVTDTFIPQNNVQDKCINNFKIWERVIKRFVNFY